MKIASVLASKGRPVITVRPEHSVGAAVELLIEHDIEALVVVDAGDVPVGIITERHIVRRLPGQAALLARPVGDVMTTDVVVCSPHDELTSVLTTMTEHRIRHLPVVDGGRLVGIISLGDVLRAQRDTYRGEAETLQTRILGEEREGRPTGERRGSWGQ
jgi:CBS domain-containing protein